MILNYRKAHFDPATLAGFTRTADAEREDWAYDAGAGEDPGARHFVFAQEAVLALNVALATKRPLLVTGEPGSGKTSLARFASRALGRVFYRETVTSRTQATDLLSSFDALQRLSDAQADKQGGVRPHQAYVVPGKIWWALNPDTARRRGINVPPTEWKVSLLEDPGQRPPAQAAGASKAAVLLDEIDKADPDVPNDLLESLDERSFTVPETGDLITPLRDDVLIILTTNGERELPPAFLRRCVSVELPKPSAQWLVEIAQRRFGAGSGRLSDPLYRQLAEEVMKLREAAEVQGRRPPSTSEYVDAVATCRQLADEGVLDAADNHLDQLLAPVLSKDLALRRESAA